MRLLLALLLLPACGDSSSDDAGEFTKALGEPCKQTGIVAMSNDCRAGLLCSGLTDCSLGMCYPSCKGLEDQSCPSIDGKAAQCLGDINLDGQGRCTWKCETDADCPTSLKTPLRCGYDNECVASEAVCEL